MRYLVTDSTRLADPVAAARRLPRGTGVILRDYDRQDRAAVAHGLAGLARRRGLVLLVGADAGLARITRAAGLHLPGWARAPLPSTRPRHWWVTAAVHSPAQARRAVRAGADAVLLSPILPTASHPGAPALGLLRAAAIARTLPVPVIALGGIDPRTARRLPPGFAGIAGISLWAEPAPIGRQNRATAPAMNRVASPSAW